MMRDARRICKFAKKRRWLKLLPSAPVGLDLRTGKMACLVPGGLGLACLQKASKFFDGNFQILDDGTEGFALASTLAHQDHHTCLIGSPDIKWRDYRSDARKMKPILSATRTRSFAVAEGSFGVTQRSRWVLSECPLWGWVDRLRREWRRTTLWPREYFHAFVNGRALRVTSGQGGAENMIAAFVSLLEDYREAMGHGGPRQSCILADFRQRGAPVKLFTRPDEDGFGQHHVHTLVSVDEFGDVEVGGDGGEHVGVVAGEMFFCNQKIDHLADGERGAGV
jgi:hypothetical protein